MKNIIENKNTIRTKAKSKILVLGLITFVILTGFLGWVEKAEAQMVPGQACRYVGGQKVNAATCDPSVQALLGLTGNTPYTPTGPGPAPAPSPTMVPGQACRYVGGQNINAATCDPSVQALTGTGQPYGVAPAPATGSNDFEKIMKQNGNFAPCWGDIDD